MPNVSDSVLPEKPAIVFHEVGKSFRIKHTGSLKQAFISATRRRSTSSSMFRAVDGVSFEVPRGQSIALMGRNGSGKSTTLKLLSGVMEPDDGWIRTHGRMAGLLEVGAGFHPDLTGRQNVYLNAAILGMSKEETDARFDEILEFSEIGEFIDTEVKRYSSGMYSRLGFSVAVHTELDTLLVDEILSVGDAQFRKKCEAKMLELQRQGKTMFIVSHNASQVKRLCQRGIVLEHGRIVFDGPIDEAVHELQRVKSDFLRTPTGAEVAVVGEIRAYHDRKGAKLGKPLHEARTVTENGGGTYQEFQKGILMHSDEVGKVLPLMNGPFLRTYQQSGGPAGPWGFLTGGGSGSVEDGGTRTLPFQHGDAHYSDTAGVRFEPRDDQA